MGVFAVLIENDDDQAELRRFEKVSRDNTYAAEQEGEDGVKLIE